MSNSLIKLTSSKSLDELARNYGLDKHISTGWHNYIPIYTQLFDSIRYQSMNILEIGIGVVEHGQMLHTRQYGYHTGNSLKCWRDYFPNSIIHGIDIYEVNLGNEQRIRTFLADQSKEEDLSRVMGEINNHLDIIIDDGSHQGLHQVFSFMFLSKFLKNGGIYVIEDIQPKFQQGFQDLSIFPVSFQSHIHKNYQHLTFDTGHKAPLNDDCIVAFVKKT